jgi:hypothetical protein
MDSSADVWNATPAFRYLWLFDGSVWSRLKSKKGWPAARLGHTLAYDSTRKVVVLAGGREYADPDSEADPHNWEWDGSTWRAVGVKSPSTREHAMVYDEARSQLVLFGGLKSQGETWVY